MSERSGAAGSVLAAETIRSQHRGKAVGAVQSSWSVGWGIAALLATLFFQVMPREYAWRALFFVGILPALFIFFIRRSVPEPDIYREQGRVKERGDPLVIFGRAIIRRTALGALLAVGAQGGYYAITTWLPTFLQKERGLTILSSGGYLAVIIIGSFVGYLVSAYLSDLIGRRSNFILFAIGSVLVVVTYTEIPINDRLVARDSRFAVTNYQFAVVGCQFAVISLAVVGSSVPVATCIIRSRGVQPLTGNRPLQT